MTSFAETAAAEAIQRIRQLASGVNTEGDVETIETYAQQLEREARSEHASRAFADTQGNPEANLSEQEQVTPDA